MLEESQHRLIDDTGFWQAVLVLERAQRPLGIGGSGAIDGAWKIPEIVQDLLNRGDPLINALRDTAGIGLLSGFWFKGPW